MMQPQAFLRIDMAVRVPRNFEKGKNSLVKAELPGEPAHSPSWPCQACDSVGQVAPLPLKGLVWVGDCCYLGFWKP